MHVICANLCIFEFPYNKLSAEETVHYALLSHPKPERVLLVGGGIGDALQELYKYKLKSVDYVELDLLLIEMAKAVIGKDISGQLQNPVLRIMESDGRFYVKASDEKYDIVIVSAPDPYTAQINRLYTLEFFEEVKKRLTKNGILTIACEASEHYIGPEMAEYLRSIHKTLKVAGFAVDIIPGETMRFLVTDSEDNLPRIDAKFFQDRLYERGVETQFVRDYYLTSRLSAERVAYAREILSDIEKNRRKYGF